MLDDIDKKILYLLQRDASLPVAEIAYRIGLSQTPCWKRIKRLEHDKYIKGTVALVDSGKVNCGLSMFVMIRTNNHSAEWLENFATAVKSFPEVVEFFRISGENDYLLRVVVADVAAYDVLYKKLISKIQLYDVTTVFSMEAIKQTTILPIDIEDKNFIANNSDIKEIF